MILETPHVHHWAGIFAHVDPVRQTLERIVRADPDWVHAMHGGTLTRAALPHYVAALREQDFGYRGTLFGRRLPLPVAT